MPKPKLYHVVQIQSGPWIVWTVEHSIRAGGPFATPPLQRDRSYAYLPAARHRATILNHDAGRINELAPSNRNA